MVAPLAIFVVTAIGLAAGRLPGLPLDRAGIAFVGAVLMIATGAITLQDALSPASIDYETLLLLLSMMVVIAALRQGGALDWLTHKALDHIKHPQGLLAATVVLSGFLSAFLVNDVVCVALTPLVIDVSRRLRANPTPQLIALATAANVGSAATITGNPQNMIIGLHSRIPYLAFAATLMPVALAGLVVTFALIALVYRRTLSNHTDPSASPPPQRPRTVPIVVMLATIALFCAGLSIPLIAAGAAAVILLTTRDQDQIYDQIDWRLLIMFAGLFIVVHAFQLRVVSHLAIPTPTSLTQLGLLTAVLSNIVSNVPAVLLLEPLAHTRAAWLTLAMASTLAGNLTILGSVANLIVIERARRDNVVITALEYAKAGVPITIATLALGLAWLRLAT